jgi:hypothetical protein
MGMHSEHEIELKEATRTAKRRAAATVGGALLLILAVGLGALFYLAPSDNAGAATRKVQRYYVHDGVERAHVQGCSNATDYERSLQLYSCKVSSRDPKVFDVMPAPTKTADTAYLCFSVQDTNVTLPPVRFFGIATRSDREVCAVSDRVGAIYEP